MSGVGAFMAGLRLSWRKNQAALGSLLMLLLWHGLPWDRPAQLLRWIRNLSELSKEVHLITIVGLYSLLGLLLHLGGHTRLVSLMSSRILLNFFWRTWPKPIRIRRPTFLERLGVFHRPMASGELLDPTIGRCLDHLHDLEDPSLLPILPD